MKFSIIFSSADRESISLAYFRRITFSKMRKSKQAKNLKQYGAVFSTLIFIYKAGQKMYFSLWTNYSLVITEG